MPRSASGWLIAACGVWLVGLGLYFILARPALLPEDPRYIGLDLAGIRTAAPGLERWLAKVFTVMGGFMTGAGLLALHLALTALQRRAPGTVAVLVLAGAATVGLMSAVNFALASDFRWLLVVPAVLWAAGTALYAWRPAPDNLMHAAL
ncbi:hypothetical protein [Piscinibacter koreensis]|uniref:hypothetical protein n=1 Tax=Piscinibacter koreensis TaxID=2742824 RepID=UPI001FE2462C|nr:hypothetical protein [Schlegelella koreensis]